MSIALFKLARLVFGLVGAFQGIDMKEEKDKDAGKSLGKSKKAVGGRDQLIQAALILASTTRSLASLGLREIARAAGLNPNTFYRHFDNFDDFTLTMILQLGANLRTSVRECWQQPMRNTPPVDSANAAARIRRARAIIHASSALAFDHFDTHKNTYITGIREIHGASPLLRKATNELVKNIADDLANDVLLHLQLPGDDEKAVRDTTLAVIRQMTFLGYEYLEFPQRRDALQKQAEQFVLQLSLGFIATHAPELIEGAALALSEG
jgi:TetR/AcrR family transcriptional regulator, fatty acid biosynthesis regulator